MPLWRALVKMIGTARVYKQHTQLYDPRSGQDWTTLSPATT